VLGGRRDGHRKHQVHYHHKDADNQAERPDIVTNTAVKVASITIATAPAQKFVRTSSRPASAILSERVKVRTVISQKGFRRHGQLVPARARRIGAKSFSA